MPRRVLVTGGAKRLGALICRHFAAAGWEVWCHYQSSAQAAHALCAELNRQGLTAFPIQADIANESQCQSLFKTINDTVGTVHCLVNNASTFEPDSAGDLEMETAWRHLEVNLLAPLFLSSLMAQTISTEAVAGEHSIIHILDQKVFNLNPDYFSYTVSKLALERAVALQAQALAPRLRVCAVAPGLVFQSGPQSPANFEHACTINLMRQATDPEQIAATCRFLAENPCITGVTIAVDNGQHLLPLPRDVMYLVEDLLKAPSHDT
ncbi:SDR family oxidoreductase [Rhodoferax sp.]|uniref:SDR family oxidoreductase n=1 Tax=Rhodoferax sp. TaxID=50421 RepID=UPI00276E62D6|nr:SDR family oxidoreductase [Rhodoferax sp.]